MLFRSGAEGYQVAVTTEGGSYVTQPDWVDVGAVTSTTLKGLSVSPGKKYFVSVRAIAKGKGSSLESKSDGVVVKAPAAMDGGLGEVSLSEDSGTPVPADTGADATTDGGLEPAPASGGGDSGGCGCRTSTRSSDVGLVVAGLVVALAASRRRRG